MNIAIMVFRGTGKTTICKLLAKSLDKQLILTDEEILRRIKTTIPKNIKRHGWDKFRDIETDIIERLSSLDDCIFDISGDIVMRNENMINLKKNSIVVLLTAGLKTIANRLKIKKNKSLLDKYDYVDELKEFFAEREARYKKSADYTIDTSGLSPEEVCELVMHYMQLELQ